MKAGTVGMSLYVPSGNSEAFTVELKAGYNFTYLRHTLAAFTVAPDGTVSIDSGSGRSAVGAVMTDQWNTFALYFDVDGGTARLTVNGESAGQFAMMDQGDRVTVVQIGIPEVSASYGSALYVDDFYAVELQAVSLPLVPERVDDTPPTPVGIPGDLTGDGKVNGKDITLLQRFFAGGYSVTLDPAAADLNHDGKVNGKDITLLQRFFAGGYGVTLT